MSNKFMDRACGYSGREIEGLLRRKGINTWGLTICPGGREFMISCPRKQAVQATYLLEQAGIPITAGAGGQAEAQPAGGRPAAPRGRSRLWQLLE